MEINEILSILKREGTPVITVFGDFCLDKYLYVDAALNEKSLETGLIAYQVVQKRLYAGAGGTIAGNLRALGAEVYCIGILGDDGEGYELIRCLNRMGANTSLMISSSKRCTCTYTKPIYCESEDVNLSEEEMNRLDFKNYDLTPSALQIQLIKNLQKAVSFSDAVIICDQFSEEDCSAVTKEVRRVTADIAAENPKVIFYADSRAYINKYKNVIVKCNQKEISDIFLSEAKDISEDAALFYAKELFAKTGKPVYVTLGERGCVVFDGKRHKIPAFPVEGPIDIVGAGDACNAGIVFALVKGADYEQAALVGNAASSIVIRQIGRTGEAKFKDLLAVLKGITAEK